MRTLYDVDDVVRGVVVKLLFNVKCFVGVGKLKSVGRIKNVATVRQLHCGVHLCLRLGYWCHYFYVLHVPNDPLGLKVYRN